MTRFRLATLSVLLAAATVHADIIVEERSLSAAAPRTAPNSGDSNAVTATAAAPAGAATTNAGSPAWQQYTQIEQLQQQLGQLQGVVEQQGFLIEKLQNDLRLRYTDLDQRFTALQEQQLQQQAAAATAAAESSAAGAATPAAASPAGSSSEEEKRAYLAAYDTFRIGGPDKAIPPMLAFVKRYPNSSFVPGAYYWLGEFYLNASTPDQDAAQKQFDIVLGNYPNSPKAAAALYKTGAILDLRGKPQEARKRMEELLQKYPQSAEASLAQSYLDALERSAQAAKAEAAKPAPASKPTTGKSAATKDAKTDKSSSQTSSRKKN